MTFFAKNVIRRAKVLRFLPSDTCETTEFELTLLDKSQWESVGHRVNKSRMAVGGSWSK